MAIPLFPVNISHDVEALGRRFIRLEGDTGDFQPLRFSLAVPNHWHPLPVARELPHGLKPLARLGTRNGQVADLRVDVVNMNRDVNPADWLEISYAAAGAQILHRNDAFGPQGKVSDLLVRCIDENGAVVRRGMIVKDGPRMLRVEVQADELTYDNVAEDLLVCLLSFELLNPIGTPTAEPIIEETFGAPVSFSFRHFDSWPAFDLLNNEYTRLLQLTSRHDEETVGYITVEVRRKSSESQLETLARDHAERLKSEGFHLHGAPLIPTNPPAGFRKAFVFAPLASYTEFAFEMPVLLFEHDEALVLLALVSPTRQESPEWWAINKRSFEMVRDSFEILDRSGH